MPQKSRFSIYTPVSGEHELLPDPGKTEALKFWQKKVGGYVETVRLVDNLIMLVNEDGRILGLPMNRAIPCMVGNVLTASYRKRGSTLVIEGIPEPQARRVLEELESNRRQREGESNDAKPQTAHL